MIANMLQVGNKVDICSINQKEKNKALNEKTPILSSRVVSIDENDEVTLEMPVYKGKLILLSIGMRYEMLFYTPKGLYSGICEVTERFKEGSCFLVNVEIQNKLQKIQRREYFRLECILGTLVYEISSDQALVSEVESLSSVITTEEIQKTESKGVIVDISGGGIRFIGEKEYPVGVYLAVILILESESISQKLTVPIRVVTCRTTVSAFVRYETRAEFVHLSEQMREIIIKFIFDEDRKIRRKDTGI
ncbi:MAG: flagellar brake domain-containing protein [bacterium]|nr:flagellar brake domain-containing protein [bacterium]